MSAAHVEQLRGQTAVVTGAARGLGRGISRAFARAGVDVVICDVSEGVEQTAGELAGETGGNVVALRADVTRPDDAARVIAEAKDRFGSVDHLVNNAGIVTIAPLLETSDEDWQRVIAVNLTGVFNFMRAALPPMLEQGAGSIVNISSQAGKRGNQYIAPYCASKAGVISLTQTAALEAAPTVRVNCVCPGFINTELQEEEYDAVSAITGEDRDEIKAGWMAAMPLGRFQEVEDVADAILFLSSKAAGQTTGEALNISGGMVMD
ncbi:MAG TPA: SDR family NAD(P)-dependent oxidoreductase [Solirubrobacterales bacterium]|jgi:NAD(P)-dependent dehydrogenase (short-subunit alcohol dehydrogenase family)